jgi:tRNA modification GTPase
MPAHVGVLTGKGFGAIGSILLSGQGAESILSKVFTPKGAFKTGEIFHGRIVQDGQTLDEVVVGCEGQNRFAIHCHGNPILIQKIVQLFIRSGAQLNDGENAAIPALNTLLEREAYIEQLKAVTIEGVKIIQSQIDGGLSATVKKWLGNSVSIEEIQKQCQAILNRSIIARRIIHGVKIVLAGPANSGKSTLLNTLAGSEKAIVSETAGTTRDWVSVFIHAGPLRAEIIDTAGLGENAIHDAVDKEAQQRTVDLMGQSDGILWIEDCTNPSKTRHLFPAGITIVEVLNKSDLPGDKIPTDKPDTVRISAKTGEGIENLLNEIQRRLQVCDFDPAMSVVFTTRQKQLLYALLKIKEENRIQKLLLELVGVRQNNP